MANKIPGNTFPNRDLELSMSSNGIVGTQRSGQSCRRRPQAAIDVSGMRELQSLRHWAFAGERLSGICVRRITLSGRLAG
jgi:hypothetical protein